MVTLPIKKNTKPTSRPGNGIAYACPLVCLSTGLFVHLSCLVLSCLALACFMLPCIVQSCLALPRPVLVLLWPVVLCYVLLRFLSPMEPLSWAEVHLVKPISWRGPSRPWRPFGGRLERGLDPLCICGRCAMWGSTPTSRSLPRCLAIPTF